MCIRVIIAVDTKSPFHNYPKRRVPILTNGFNKKNICQIFCGCYSLVTISSNLYANPQNVKISKITVAVGFDDSRITIILFK